MKYAEVLVALLEWLHRTYGPWAPLLVVVGLPVLGLSVYLLFHRRKISSDDRAFAAQERAIQRLAGDNRQLKALLYKQAFNLADNEVERLLLIGEGDGPHASPALPPPASKGKKSKGNKS